MPANIGAVVLGEWYIPGTPEPEQPDWFKESIVAWYSPCLLYTSLTSKVYVLVGLEEYNRTNIIHLWDGNDMVVMSERLFIGEVTGTAYDGSLAKTGITALLVFGDIGRLICCRYILCCI